MYTYKPYFLYWVFDTQFQLEFMMILYLIKICSRISLCILVFLCLEKRGHIDLQMSVCGSIGLKTFTSWKKKQRTPIDFEVIRSRVKQKNIVNRYLENPHQICTLPFKMITYDFLMCIPVLFSSFDIEVHK